MDLLLYLCITSFGRWVESWPIRPPGAILQSLLGQDVVSQLLIQPGVTQDVAATDLFSQVLSD